MAIHREWAERVDAVGRQLRWARATVLHKALELALPTIEAAAESGTVLAGPPVGHQVKPWMGAHRKRN